MKTRYSARKATTCKVTLSCGARVGEGQILDLTVPGCLIETAVVFRTWAASPTPRVPGQAPAHAHRPWNCAMDPGWQGGH